MFEILSATHVTFDQLHETMLSSFSDYAIPMQLSLGAFEMMMRQRGLDLHSSRVAVVDGQVAAIWLTSVRGSKGYLISSGTRPEFRSKGLARAMANDCLDYLRSTGIRSFQTEVLRDNETAAGLYYSLGMTKARALDCYTLPISQASKPGSELFEPVYWRDLAPRVAKLRDWAPSWQNNDASMEAIADQLLCVAMIDEGGELKAYAAVSPNSGTVHQLAVSKDYRRRGMARAALIAIQRQLPETPLRLINVQQDDAAFRALMTSVSATETSGQYELWLDL
ncbi:GNAT family N-acetyltransferase [Parasedimentitalea denitrificans]|nr:GNAT family N-acetyltransferase [Sedimentitalea sp. CY04]